MLGLDTLNVVSLNAEVIEALSITADKIAANAVTADKILAGAVTADKISVSQLSAISANLGTITAGLLQAVTIIGSYIATSTGFPRVELSSASNFIKAMQDANKFILITPFSGSTPALQFFDGVTADNMLMFLNGASNLFSMASPTNIDIFADGNELSLRGNTVTVPQWSQFVNDATAQTLQAALDAKADAFSGFTGTVYVAATSGGPVTTPKTFVNGVCTS